MQLSLSSLQLSEYVSLQLNHFFPDAQKVDLRDYQASLDLTLHRLEYCFKHAAFKSYFDGRQTFFNHLITDQYTLFLWFLSNTLWKELGLHPILDKLFYLNKAFNGFQAMYDTQLPDIFLVFHTVGIVLGKAHYSDFLVVSQGCTVGSHKEQYPALEKGVALAANASVIGNCSIGKRVSIGSHTQVFNRSIMHDTTVYKNDQGQICQRSTQKPYAQRFFNIDLQQI